MSWSSEFCALPICVIVLTATICIVIFIIDSVSGFVAQGSPDLILKSLADRYEQECKDGIKDGVGNLTILFGGGPGDWDSRGLNYLASIPQLEDGSTAPPMIKRAIGAHFGQVPMLGEFWQYLKQRFDSMMLNQTCCSFPSL